MKKSLVERWDEIEALKKTKVKQDNMAVVRSLGQTVMGALLAPLARHYSDPQVVEVRMNGFGQVVVEHRQKGKYQVEDTDLTPRRITAICKALANTHGLSFGVDSPKISCTLPGGHRFECATGPSVQNGVSLAIRCKHPYAPTWAQMGVSEDIVEYITTKTQEQVNVIVSGGTNTGKTTLLNKLLDLYPEDHRVIFVEDTPELQNERFWDGSSLLAAREMGTGEGMLGHGQLYDHLNRITPSTIFYGEISKDNAEPATNVLNSGIKGFMCSIHANSPVEVIKNKFQQLIRQSSGRTIDGLDTYLQENIDVILQLTRSGDGTRSITDIYEPANNRWILKNSEVQNV